jgi:hypothetical protein
MRAMKAARKRIEKDPTSPTGMLLTKLVLSLEGQGNFEIKDLYDLDFDAFDLAMQLLNEWRLDRHFSAKFRLMDMAVASTEFQHSKAI